MSNITDIRYIGDISTNILDIFIPGGKKPVGCKWVFVVKFKGDSYLERYKARLVAKGYTHTYGVDYQETFAPVAKMNIVRILLSLAANFDWELQQYDVKTCFPSW